MHPLRVHGDNNFVVK